METGHTKNTSHARINHKLQHRTAKSMNVETVKELDHFTDEEIEQALRIINERKNQAAFKVKKDVSTINAMMNDIKELVDDQQVHIDLITHNTVDTKENVIVTDETLISAEKKQRWWPCVIS